MAYFTARDAEPAEYCTGMVANADVFVGIIGHRYGAPVPARPQLSYTELEFEAATNLGLPRLVFLVRENAESPVLANQSSEDARRQSAFRDRLLTARLTTAWVRTPAELEIGLHQSLVELEARTMPRLVMTASELARAPTPPRILHHTDELDGPMPMVVIWARLDQPEIAQAITLLRRYAGLTRDQLVERMWNVSGDANIGVDTSLVYRWERGERNRPPPRPGARYRRLLGLVCERQLKEMSAMDRREFLRQLALLGGSPLVLGGIGTGSGLLPYATPLDAMSTLLAVDALQTNTLPPAGMPARLSPPIVENLEGITVRHRQLYWTLPAEHFIHTVTAHLRLSLSLLRTPTSPPDLRKRLLAASAETALLAGRILFFDLRREAEARRYLTAALDLAQTAGDPQLTAAAFAHMAFIPGFAGKLLDAQDHMRGAALHASRGATPNVRAWLGAVESEVAARSGDHRSGVAAIVRAEELYEGAASPADPPWFDWFSPELLASFAGYTYMRAGDLVVARDRLTGAIAGLPAERIKQRVVLLADLARVEVERGEIEEAGRLLVESMTPLSATGYATGLERVREVRGELDGWRNEPAVRRLDEVLYGVGQLPA